MKKQPIKIKVLKNIQKGLPKDPTKAASTQQKDTASPDSLIPAMGTVITKKYQGEELQVKVIKDGFEYKGQIFKSISALAVHIIDAPISGYVFFKLGAKND